MFDLQKIGEWLGSSMPAVIEACYVYILIRSVVGHGATAIAQQQCRVRSRLWNGAQRRPLEVRLVLTGAVNSEFGIQARPHTTALLTQIKLFRSAYEAWGKIPDSTLVLAVC